MSSSRRESRTSGEQTIFSSSASLPQYLARSDDIAVAATRTTEDSHSEDVGDTVPPLQPVGSRRNSLTRYTSSLPFMNSSSRQIPARDRVMLSTWEKWVTYGRFPYKLALHIALLVVTTWQLLQFNVNDASYIRAANRNWYYYFFPEDYDFESRQYFLYTIDDAVKSVNKSVVSYNDIVMTSVDKVSHPTVANDTCQIEGHCTDGKMEVIHYRKPPRELFNDKVYISDSDLEEVRDVYWINASTLGPLDLDVYTYEQVADFIQSIIWMDVTYYLVAHGPADSGRSCVVWRIRLHYDFRYRGQLKLTLRSRVVESCTEKLSFLDMMQYQVHQLNLSIIILSIWSLILSVRSVITSASLLSRVQRKYRRRKAKRILTEDEIGARFTSSTCGDDDSSYLPLNDSANESIPDFNEEEAIYNFNQRYGRSGGNAADEDHFAFQQLSCRDKLRFFNLWFVLTSVAALLNITNAALGLVNDQRFTPVGVFEKLLSGFGCSLLWVNLIAFLTHKPSYYTIVLTLQRAVPRVARFLLGVMPILLGYALFGMLYFGDHSERFGSFGYSLITLFAVLNGDVIRETFMDLISLYPVVSQVYLYSFVCLFIYVVLNVFIAIVEESFFSTRAKARSLETFAKEFKKQEGRKSENNIKVTEDGVNQQRSTNNRLHQLSVSASCQGVGAGSGASSLPPSGPPQKFSSLDESGQSYEWGRDEKHELEHRKLKWLRKVLNDLDHNKDEDE